LETTLGSRCARSIYRRKFRSEYPYGYPDEGHGDEMHCYKHRRDTREDNFKFHGEKHRDCDSCKYRVQGHSDHDSHEEDDLNVDLNRKVVPSVDLSSERGH